MKCDYDCLNCIYADCINDSIRKVDVSESDELERDIRRERYLKYLLNLKKGIHSSDGHLWYYKKRDKYISYQINRYRNKSADLIAYQLDRYYSHQQELIAYQLNRYYENRERLKAYQRDYYNKNKERINAKRKLKR